MPSGSSLSPSLARLRRGPGAVPSVDSSRWPPCFARFSVKGERPKPNSRHKKKTMKTPSENQTKAGLLNRPEQAGTNRKTRIDLTRRHVNRRLRTRDVLSLLRCELPGTFGLAEVVGRWVWVRFEDKQPATVTRALSELGFHWNSNRQTWQHPCGSFRSIRASRDPRRTYPTYFPADNQPA